MNITFLLILGANMKPKTLPTSWFWGLCWALGLHLWWLSATCGVTLRCDCQLPAQICQHSSNLASTWPNLAQLGSNLAQLGPNLAQLGPNLAQLGSTWPQHSPNIAQLSSNIGFWRPTWHLKSTQIEANFGTWHNFKSRDFAWSVCQKWSFGPSKICKNR